LYRTVAQPASVPTKALVTIAVLGNSVEVTLTLLDWVGPNVTVARRSEWPLALTVSVTVVNSADWFTVKVHVLVVPGATSSAEQSVLVTLPTLPAGQAGVNPLAVKTLPYALSQIWSTVMPPRFERLLTATV